MASFNQYLVDKFIRHAIDLEKFKASERRKALRILKELEQRLVADLARADLPGYSITAYQQARMQALLAQTRGTIATAYKNLRDVTLSAWQELAAYEAQWVLDTINAGAGVELASVAVSAEVLREVASGVIIEGGPAAEWWSRQAVLTQQMFADSVRQGIIAGDTSAQIERAVRDDVMTAAGQNADALVRTAIQQVMSESRVRTFQANDDVISAIQQHSTLDTRTTAICIAYSGATYTNDGKFTPLDGSPPYNGGIPRHWACRSFWVPVVRAFSQFRGLQTGGRPTDDAEQYFQTRLKAQGLTDEEAARVVARAQASMNGQVADTMTYEQWLKTQPVSVQKEVLGPGRWDLWTRGKISLTDLIDQTAHPRTLDQLKKAG